MAILLLALASVALLVAGVTGVAIHHRSSAGTTPPGYQRLVDTTDHFSLAVPGAWRALPVSTGQIGADLAALKASSPQLAPLLDLALSGLQRVQTGVFALDVASRTSLFTYGLDQPGVSRLSDIRVADGVAALRDAGAKNVMASLIHLPLGPAERLSAQVSVGADTLIELLDYFVLGHRVVAIVLATRGTAAPTDLFHRIETSLAPAS